MEQRSKFTFQLALFSLFGYAIQREGNESGKELAIIWSVGIEENVRNEIEKGMKSSVILSSIYMAMIATISTAQSSLLMANTIASSMSCFLLQSLPTS